MCWGFEAARDNHAKSNRWPGGTEVGNRICDVGFRTDNRDYGQEGEIWVKKIHEEG